MTHYVYILQSEKDGRFYFGQTQNIVKRFERHNSGGSSYTSKFIPWRLIWLNEVDSRKNAFAQERKLKALKSRSKVIQYINENPGVSGSENFQISDLIDFRES